LYSLLAAHRAHGRQAPLVHDPFGDEDGCLLLGQDTCRAHVTSARHEQWGFGLVLLLVLVVLGLDVLRLAVLVLLLLVLALVGLTKRDPVHE
jgi:hypothetical protein